MLQIQVVEKIEPHVLCSVKFGVKFIGYFLGNKETHGRARQATDNNTGRFIMFFVITNIYNNCSQPQEKCRSFFWQLEMFDVCTTGDTAHIDTIFKFLPHTRQHGASIFFAAAMIRAVRSARSRGDGGTYT